MGDKKLECDQLNSVSDIEEIIQKCINNIVKRNVFVKYTVDKRSISNKGTGYLSVSYEVNITGTNNDGEKEINVFIKNIIPNFTVDSFLPLKSLFYNEYFVYSKLSKIFEDLQEANNIPMSERYQIIKGYEESSPKAIVLENLSKMGYTMIDRMEIPSLRFMELAMEQLAKFHGLNFMIEKKMPEYFENKIRTMKYPVDFNHHWEEVAKNNAKIAIKGLDIETKKKAENFIPNYIAKYKQHYLEERSVKTLCHGDYRICNMFIKEKNGEITKLVPIDYQIIYYGCPINDILFFIYGCTDKQFRKKHLNYLFDFYYDTLSKFLVYFNVDVSNVYPRKEFDLAIEDRADVSLLEALYFYPIFFADENDAMDLSEDVTAIDFDLDEKITLRLKELFDEHLELGLL